MVRENFWWNQNGTEIRYCSNISYTLNESSSDPNAHNITTINVPLLVSLGLLRRNEREKEGRERDGKRWIIEVET